MVRWRRAQIVLWSAQRMDVPAIAKIAFTSEDRVREVIHNFNDDGFDSLAPKYAGGRPPTFTLPAASADQEDRACLARTDHDLPFSTWSLSKLAEFLVAEGVVDDISHEGLRALAPRGGRVVSSDQDVQAEQRPRLRSEEEPDPRALRHRRRQAPNLAPGDPTVVICMDEFGPLNLQPHPGKQWAPVAAGKGDAEQPASASATGDLHPPHGVRHLMAGYDLSTDRLYGHVVKPQAAAPSSWRSAATCARCTRPRCGSRSCSTTSARTCPPSKDPRVGEWAAANNVELAYTPFYASWLNRIEAQFTALRYFALDGTDHASHREQAR